MKRFVSAAFLFLSLSLIGLAQTSMNPGMQNAPARKSPMADYAGTWIGSFQGHPWMTIRLTLQGTQVGGTVQRAHDFQFNDDGELKSVSDEHVTEAVENSVINGDGLLLTVKDSGSQATDRYLLRLTSADTAEVKMVGMSMPPGMPKPKPWKLSRVGPNAITPVR